MTDRITQKERKVLIAVMLTSPEIQFLDRKINKKNERLMSRSQIMRNLIHKAMAEPSLLD